MKFKEFLEIYESKKSKRDAYRTSIDRLSAPIVLHLIKVLKYKDPYNYNKHLKDIDNWLSIIKKLSSKPQPPKEKDYLEMLMKTDEEFLNYFNELNKDYSVPVIETDENIKIRIKEILEQLSKDLYNKEFKTIKEYIEK